MVLATICAVAVTALIRWVGQDVPAAQSAFLRFAFGTLILLPVLWPLLRTGLPAGSGRAFALRGVVHIVAVLLTYVAIVRIPIAEVTAINYLIPVFVSVGAVWVYGEPILARRVAAVLLGLSGALVILRPGLRELGTGHVAQVLATVFFSASYLFVKHLNRLVSPGQVVAMLCLSVSVGMAPLAWVSWGPVTPIQLFWIALTGLLSTLGHYCMTQSFKVAPLLVVQPAMFVQLVWSVAVGSAVFGDATDPWVIFGGVIILGAVVALSWREGSLSRQSRPVAGV